MKEYIRAKLAEWAKRVWEWAQHDEALVLEDVAEDAMKLLRVNPRFILESIQDRTQVLINHTNPAERGHYLAMNMLDTLAIMKAEGHNIQGEVRAILHRG